MVCDKQTHAHKHMHACECLAVKPLVRGCFWCEMKSGNKILEFGKLQKAFLAFWLLLNTLVECY